MRYTNLIWDFDGTLYNSYPRMTDTFLKALEELGVKAPWEEVARRIKRTVGGAAREYAAEAGLEKADIMDRYRRIDAAKGTQGLILYPGMDDLLRDAARLGARHFLYTHRNRGALNALEADGLLCLFSGAITDEDPFPHKPAPDALFSLLSRYDIPPDSALMLGDRDIDMLAAQNAGIDGLLFDLERFYDDLNHPLKAYSVEELREKLGLSI